VIDKRPEAVQVLVDGIARSGMWLNEGRSHREHAADFVGHYYYNQSPKVLRRALTNPRDRVRYTHSRRSRRISTLSVTCCGKPVFSTGRSIDQYVDTRFAEGARIRTAWKYDPGDPAAR
jgi:NitT/TauT family transport system substrate-binding protein